MDKETKEVKEVKPAKPVSAEYDADTQSDYVGRVNQQLSDVPRFAAAVDGIGKFNKPVRAAQELSTPDEVLDFFEKCFERGSEWDKSNGPIKAVTYSLHDSLRTTAQHPSMREKKYDREAFLAFMNETTVEMAAEYLWRKDFNTNQPKKHAPVGATSAGLPPAPAQTPAPEAETGPFKPSIH
jgi:hypothetical protein